MADKTYSISEAAALLDRHPNTIRQKIKQGLLKATVQQGKFGEEYRISYQALVDAGMAQPEPAPEPDPAAAEPAVDAVFATQDGLAPSEAGSSSDPGTLGGAVAALSELYQRHEHAMFRLGYLQGELERVKALADTAESLRQESAQREQELQAVRAALEERERQAREAEALRQELEQAQTRLQEMEALRQDIDRLKAAVAEQEQAAELARQRPWWQIWR